jgi:hypothetical protein
MPERHTLTFACNAILRAVYRIPFQCPMSYCSIPVWSCCWSNECPCPTLETSAHWYSNQWCICLDWVHTRDMHSSCQMNVMVILFKFDVVHINLTLLWRRPSMSSWMKNFWTLWQEWLAIYGTSRIWFRKWIVPSLHVQQVGGSQWVLIWNGWKQAG